MACWFRPDSSAGFQVTNISLAFPGLAGHDRRHHRLVGLLAQRGWGVILAIVALSMSLASFPYGIVRLAMGAQPAIGLWSVLLAVLHVTTYWCH